MHRAKAREKIIQEANKWKLRKKNLFGIRFYGDKLFGPKQLQQAVCCVRRHRLVDPQVLIDAGFATTGKR